MLAEENKNAGTSALEGKAPTNSSLHWHRPSYVRWSLSIQRGERNKGGTLWDLKPKSLCHKILHALKGRELSHKFLNAF